MENNEKPAKTEQANAEIIEKIQPIENKTAVHTALLTEKIAPTTTENSEPKIQYADFEKVDLRVSTVLSAEKVEGSEKLLKLRIRCGKDEERTLMAGIAKYYSPEELKDKKIIIVYNLAPRKLKGIESQGMLLAAEDEEQRVALLTVDKFVSEGATIH